MPRLASSAPTVIRSALGQPSHNASENALDYTNIRRHSSVTTSGVRLVRAQGPEIVPVRRTAEMV